MQFKHISLVARNAAHLAEFYKSIFGCTEIRSPKTLTGEAVSRGNGLPGSEILSIWLSLPGVDGPFLEIHEYRAAVERPVPQVNEPGYGHMSFSVGDIRATSAAILQSGGKALGEITNFGTEESPVLLVYIRDPEGNILELEQS
ncbi:VOC family protein [Labrenzia sp. PHM005]|uniref:VOC family protein n=1 Tax=Labrenzia sp. PHM005 TaxID=2590016 RepID=UPI00113FF0A2|nr:VOC family protein [Labrenzia sp. PHM005]QDG79201.1 VOC family protein [Labrenzia sp. PHM005]